MDFGTYNDAISHIHLCIITHKFKHTTRVNQLLVPFLSLLVGSVQVIHRPALLLDL
ncbi:MAG: hypothetical protein HRU28_08315 [Rhizobiales bacterium]|nr:hypothetical protein [Hyphomicrobiales bacterium]